MFKGLFMCVKLVLYYCFRVVGSDCFREVFQGYVTAVKIFTESSGTGDLV